MKLHTLIRTTVLSLLSFTAAYAAAPVNDSVTKAVTFTGPYQRVTTPDVNTATAAATDPLINGASAGKTIWYKVMKPSVAINSPTWRISVKSTTGTGFAALYSVGDVDNPATSLTILTAPAAISLGQTVDLSGSAGQMSVLMVSGSGVFEITHHHSKEFGFGGNDFPITAYDLGNAAKATHTGRTLMATVTADEPSLPVSVSNTIWYKWTSPSSIFAHVDTNFSFLGYDSGASNNAEHDTVIAVYSGQPGALNLQAWDDDSGWRTNSRASFFAQANQTYYIAVSTKAGTPPGYTQLHCFLNSASAHLEFSPSADNASGETDFFHSVKVRRQYALAATASATLTTSNGTATAGTDYTALTTTLSFAASGDSAFEAEAFVGLLDDLTNEFSETVNLTLSNASGVTIPNPIAFSIVDNDAIAGTPQNPFAIAQPTVRVKESAAGPSGTYFTVNELLRTSIGGGDVGVVQIMESGTATPGFDLEVTASLFPAYDNRAPLAVNTVDDDVFEADETMLITVKVPGLHNYSANLSYTLIIEDDDPYLPIAGKLVAPVDYGSRRGEVFVTVSATGALSGKLMLVGQTLAFKAQLSERGRAAIPLAPTSRAGGPGMMLTIQATDATGGFDITLNDGLTNSASTSSTVLQNYAAVVYPSPEAGRYTFTTDVLFNVDTTSVGSVVVDFAGNAVVSGRLFDGTSFTCAGYVNGDGQMSAMSGLYANTGNIAFASDLPLSTGQTSALSGRIARPARAGDATKLGAINFPTTGVVCRYTPPTTGQRALDCWSTGNGKATLSNGPLMNKLTKTLTISTTNIITAPVDAEKLKLTLVPSTGLFSGSFVLPGSSPAKTLTIYGALIDLPTTNGYGQGFFFDGLKGGKIVIGKP